MHILKECYVRTVQVFKRMYSIGTNHIPAFDMKFPVISHFSSVLHSRDSITPAQPFQHWVLHTAQDRP